ncbi:hypothetical protein [Legionella worsleiensis]|nr:hypothetical protein [Legionella worsleiensis]
MPNGISDQVLRNTHESKNLIPIDIHKISQKLKSNPEIIFGRLHYYLAEKYKYKNSDGSLVTLFVTFTQKEKHCVHYSYLSSVLAELKNERFIFLTNTTIASISAFIAAISAFISSINNRLRTNIPFLTTSKCYNRKINGEIIILYL